MKTTTFFGALIIAILLLSSYSKSVDIDTNQVIIGDQIWMAENLRTNKFRNGDPIPQAQTDEEWIAAGENHEPAWCYYQNDPDNAESYGKLYNWYAVTDPRGLAPEGWRVATDEDWREVVQFYGGSRTAGRRLAHRNAWEENGYNPDKKGFLALPGGLRYRKGNFGYLADVGFWWSSTEKSSDHAWFRRLDTYYGEINRFNNEKSYGFSVRCVKE